FQGKSHRLALTELTGRSIWIYGQQEVVKDLVQARLDSGLPLLYEAEALGIDGFQTERPVIRFRQAGEEDGLEWDFVAGCDGFHGISRGSVPDGPDRLLPRVSVRLARDPRGRGTLDRGADLRVLGAGVRA